MLPCGNTTVHLGKLPVADQEAVCINRSMVVNPGLRYMQVCLMEKVKWVFLSVAQILMLFMHLSKAILKKRKEDFLFQIMQVQTGLRLAVITDSFNVPGTI